MRLVLACVIMAWLCINVLFVAGDVGTASSYDPPYLPTKCPGYSKDEFPEGSLFVAVSPGLWDNGAACGRKYRLLCLSGQLRPCKDGSIVVEVVDVCRHRPCPTTLVLPNRAFEAISRVPNQKINIEYAQV